MRSIFLYFSAFTRNIIRGEAAPAFGRMKGDRREAVVEDFRHKRVEPTRPKSFIFRILGRFSPCNTDSIDASKKHPVMQKLKLFGCSQF